MKDKLDSGRYELRLQASRFGFFSSGRTTALLCKSGNTQSENDLLHIVAISGATWLPTLFKSQVEIGSRMHCLLGDLFSSSSITSSGVTWLKVSSL